ncbi:MerR family transcriptional regulator [Paenibacillus sp. J31TS4]|uniref:MerR family transcriptional regulator n=1 Tax=Paenibacillus sp. J31TS4 TaxID=2807195 RepID=UPI001B1BD566|nr:MerR family transcriptional regulator [Paenibacillus sp. J31TS4]GIP36898.1 MerR family transcriptional regulator [Paenibacillus sp. J31TS4]
MARLKIEEVAKRTGLTKRTIRFYEEINLIQPPQRSEGGIRLYTEEDVEKLQRILDARNVLGYSLQELQQYLATRESVLRFENETAGEASSEREAEAQEWFAMKHELEEQLALIGTKLEKMERFKQEMTALLRRLEAAMEASGVKEEPTRNQPERPQEQTESAE